MPASSPRLDRMMIGVLSPAARQRAEHLDAVECPAGRGRAGRGRASSRRAAQRLGGRVAGLDDVVALRRRGSVRSSRRIGGSSSTTRTRTPAAVTRRASARGDQRRAGSVTVKTRARPVGAVAGGDACRPSPRRSRGRWRGRGRCRRGRGRPLGTRWNLSKTRSSSSGGMPGALVEDLDRDAAVVGARGLDRDRRAVGRVFRGVVEEVDQHLLEQHRRRPSSIGRSAARSTVDVGGRRAAPGAALQRASPTTSPMSTGCAARARSAPDSSRVMSRRLATKRSSRSASAWIVASEFVALLRVESVGDIGAATSAAPMIEASGVFRSCEIEVSSAERSRSASAATRGRLDVARRGRRARSRPRPGRPARRAGGARRASGAGPGRSRVEPDDADGAAAGARSAGTAAARRAACRRRGPPGWLFSKAHLAAAMSASRACPRADSRPARRCAPSRPAGAARRRASSMRGDLVGGRPEQVVERGDAGELAAEGVERLGGAGAAPARSAPGARTGRRGSRRATATTRKSTKRGDVGRARRS